jgi:RHS repeat-associated protein
VAVTIPMTVRVEGVDHSPFEGVKVYAFDGTTYKGYSGTSGKDGQVAFTLPQGNYRFRGDLNGTQFWSSAENACTLPGCASSAITLPGGNTSRSAVTINYTYDGLSRLTAADYSSGDYYHYTYDAVGNRLTETTAKGETAYTYDPANRLTSVNGQAVQWDDNGNMLADGQAVYKYNTANKLVGVTKGASSIVYAYSGLGDRLKQIADGVTTDYTLDINAGLTQVLDDGTNKYLYGNQRIAQIAETQTGYFLTDALGSMRQMTDPSADLTLARTYDPYGNVVSSSGAGETVYGYTGEIQSGGLVHLRARDYASQLGRFTSRDTWEGSSNTPLSYNKWTYVEGNPIRFIDPTGQSVACALGDTSCQYQILFDYRTTQRSSKLFPFSLNLPYKYNPEQNPPYIFWKSNTNAEKIAMGKAPLYGNDDKLLSNAEQAQFNIKNHLWSCEYEKDKEGNLFCKKSTICNANFCGQVVISALMKIYDDNITTKDVIEKLAPSHPGCDGTTYKDLSDFINKQYGEYIESKSISGIYTASQLPTFLKDELSNNRVVFPQVGLPYSIHNYLGTGGLQIRHWVLITGISEQWDYTNDSSEWNWVRIYNPFDNRTEYYWWEDFRNAWNQTSKAFDTLSIRFKK